MKRAFRILIPILSAVFVLFSFSACNRDGDAFAKTPEAEYKRVCNLHGENQPFDFNYMTSFAIEHTGTIRNDGIYTDAGAGSANIDTIFQYNMSGDTVKSYSTANTIWNFSGSGAPDYNTPVETGYQNGAYYWGYGSPDARPYQEILDLADTTGNMTPDVWYRRNSALPNPELLENFTGGRSGGTYTVMANVKADAFDGFAAWMKVFYRYLRLTDGAGYDGEFLFFDFAAEQKPTAQITLQSNKQMPLALVVQLTCRGRESQLRGEVQFDVRTTFQSGRVTVRDITED